MSGIRTLLLSDYDHNPANLSLIQYFDEQEQARFYRCHLDLQC